MVFWEPVSPVVEPLVVYAIGTGSEWDDLGTATPAFIGNLPIVTFIYLIMTGAVCLSSISTVRRLLSVMKLVRKLPPNLTAASEDGSITQKSFETLLQQWYSPPATTSQQSVPKEKKNQASRLGAFKRDSTRPAGPTAPILLDQMSGPSTSHSQPPWMAHYPTPPGTALPYDAPGTMPYGMPPPPTMPPYMQPRHSWSSTTSLTSPPPDFKPAPVHTSIPNHGPRKPSVPAPVPTQTPAQVPATELKSRLPKLKSRPPKLAPALAPRLAPASRPPAPSPWAGMQSHSAFQDLKPITVSRPADGSATIADITDVIDLVRKWYNLMVSAQEIRRGSVVRPGARVQAIVEVTSKADIIAGEIKHILENWMEARGQWDTVEWERLMLVQQKVASVLRSSYGG